MTGAVTNFNHSWIDDCTGAGTIGTQYGYYCSALTKESTNWQFYGAGSTASRFGEVAVGDNVWLTPSDTSLEFGWNVRYRNGDWYPTKANNYYVLWEPHEPGSKKFAMFTGSTPSSLSSPI